MPGTAKVLPIGNVYVAGLIYSEGLKNTLGAAFAKSATSPNAQAYCIAKSGTLAIEGWNTSAPRWAWVARYHLLQPQCKDQSQPSEGILRLTVLKDTALLQERTT